MLLNGSICIYLKKGTNVVIFFEEFEKNLWKSGSEKKMKSDFLDKSIASKQQQVKQQV